MGQTRYASVLGLGFGDCGKGHFIDALARRWQAHTVVRFNGGAQAGHNVVTSSMDGVESRHHTFSQFGAGTFVPGVRTLLLHPTVVHPTALLVEAEVLGLKGVHDALARLTIDAQCRVTTPYHQAAGRLRELLRGDTAHGTCGVGVGETVHHSLEHPEQVIRYGDFAPSGSAGLQVLRDKLQGIRQALLAGLQPQLEEISTGSVEEELQVLHDDMMAGAWLNYCRALARQCPPASPVDVQKQLIRPGCVLFEGAQGVLLDEWRGFHPHTTWSTISTQAVENAVARHGIDAPVEHYGVLRSYLTRHGHGPMPTQDPSLDDHLPEPHNHAEGWQGQFRRGHPDAVLLRYALEAVGKLSGLLVGHLDVFEQGLKLKWCESYLVPASIDSSNPIGRLPLGDNLNDLNHQEHLTRLLHQAQPQYGAEVVGSPAALLDRIASITDLPVVFCSHGPTATDVFETRAP